MTREILVTIHAVAGAMGLFVGLTVIPPPKTRQGWPRIWRIVYGALLTVLLVSLLAMLVGDWSDLDTGARIAFTGLSILACLMLVRLHLADRLASHGGSGWEVRYVSHVYFTYISLWVGAAVIPALRSGNPGLWIPIAVVAVLACGALLIRRYEERIGVRPTSPTHPV